MPRYEIFENRHLESYREGGIKPNDIKIGFLDFLREIKAGADDLPRLSAFMVTGIDEVLYMTKADERPSIARKIHNILQSAAPALQRKRIHVQIICNGKLTKGDSLWIEYRGEKLPIDLIFGSTTTNDVRGVKVYTTGFNLST